MCFVNSIVVESPPISFVLTPDFTKSNMVDSSFAPTSRHFESLCFAPNQSSIILIESKNDEGFAIFCPAISNAAP